MAGGWRVLYPGQRDDSCFDLMYLLAGGVDNRGMFLISAAKKRFCGWVKTIIMVPTVTATIFLVLFLAWNWILYSFNFEEKVEQYDEHIALYVDNTFVRTRFRYPHYMYEENWLIMRRLSDDELNEAILKYGDPDNYYK